MHPALWTFLAIGLLLAGVYELWQGPRRRVRHLLRAVVPQRAGRAGGADEQPVRRAIGWLSEKFRPWLPSSRMEEARMQLLWAGRPFNWSAEEYLVYRAVLALAAAAAPPLLFHGSRMGSFWITLAAAGVALVLPDRLLRQRIEERTRQLRRDLPHFTHLLATALEAGMPMVEAVRRVASEAPGLLGAEMLRTIQEMAAGRPPALAWQDLSRRTNCTELRELVAAITQSQEYGVGIAEQLRFQMQAARLRKKQQANQRAQAAIVMMKLPIVLLIFLPAMITLAVPGLMKFTQILRGG